MKVSTGTSTQLGRTIVPNYFEICVNIDVMVQTNLDGQTHVRNDFVPTMSRSLQAGSTKNYRLDQIQSICRQ